MWWQTATMPTNSGRRVLAQWLRRYFLYEVVESHGINDLDGNLGRRIDDVLREFFVDDGKLAPNFLRHIRQPLPLLQPLAIF